MRCQRGNGGNTTPPPPPPSRTRQPARILDVTSSGVPYLPLLRSYSSFAFRRMTEVHGGPKQVQYLLSQQDYVADLQFALMPYSDRHTSVPCRHADCINVTEQEDVAAGSRGSPSPLGQAHMHRDGLQGKSRRPSESYVLVTYFWIR